MMIKLKVCTESLWLWWRIVLPSQPGSIWVYGAFKGRYLTNMLMKAGSVGVSSAMATLKSRNSSRVLSKKRNLSRLYPEYRTIPRLQSVQHYVELAGLNRVTTSKSPDIAIKVFLKLANIAVHK